MEILIPTKIETEIDSHYQIQDHDISLKILIIISHTNQIYTYLISKFI